LASPRLLIALLAATLGLAVTPALAAAQAPDNDDYLDSARINQPNEPLEDHFEDLGTNTDDATVQVDPDLFGTPGGNFDEIVRCDFPSGRKAYYGRTVWYDIFPDVDGVVRVQAGGFDAVVGIVPYDSNAEPFYDEWFCADDPGITSVETEFFDVQAGRAYSIQVGGWGGDEGDPGAGPDNAASGNLEFVFDFFRDSDGDGVLDDNDSCPHTAGLSQFAGCPDGDGDGVPEPPDACPGVKGDLANGCAGPPPCVDNDSDNRCENRGEDQCAGEDASARDANRNGCLDLAPMNPKWIFKPDTYFTRRNGRVVLLGLAIKRFGVTNVPKGARVVVSCSRRACRRMSKRAKSRVVFRKLSGDKFRAGVKVTIRVAAPGYVGAARVYTIQKNDYTTKTRCLMPGSAKLRTTCSPVR
jgi:hypothetical protein